MEDDAPGAAVEPAAEETPVTRTEMRPARGRTFLPQVTGVEFSVARRGYERAEVDAYVEQISRIVVELEAMRSPDAVIERALADVGEETSAILRRARKAAEEMVSDAEAQAEQRAAAVEAEAGRLRDEAEEMVRDAEAQTEQRAAAAEAEAGQIRDEADQYGERVRQESDQYGERVQQEADQYGERVRQEADQVLAQARTQSQQAATAAAANAGRIRTEAEQYQAQVISHMEALSRDRHQLIEDLRKLADHFHRTADRALEQIPAPLKPYETTPADGADSNPASAGGGIRSESRESS